MPDGVSEIAFFEALDQALMYHLDHRVTHPDLRGWPRNPSEPPCDFPSGWKVEFDIVRKDDEDGPGSITSIVATVFRVNFDVGDSTNVVWRGVPIKREVEVDVFGPERSIIVWDNGPGMSKDTLAKVRHMMHDNVHIQRTCLSGSVYTVVCLCAYMCVLL